MRVDRERAEQAAPRIAAGAARAGMVLNPGTVALLAAFAGLRTHIDDEEDRLRIKEKTP